MGGRWVIRDLGSRNGTQLAGRRLQTGEDYPLSVGDALIFGACSGWTFEDDAPPLAVARPLSGGSDRLAVGGLLALPSDDEPVAVIYQSTDSDWVIELDGSSRSVRDREFIQVGEQAWQLLLPLHLARTTEPGSGPELRFQVSLDEEHVVVVAIENEVRFELGARAHNYLLLTLARQRLSDRAAGLPEAERGWMHRDVLIRGLRLEPGHLNLLVHRARTAFVQAGLTGGGGLLERRINSGHIRLSTKRIQVLK